MRGLLRRKSTWAALAFAVVAAVVALWAFQPWRIFTRSTVDEALPAEFAQVAAPASAQAPASTTTTPPAVPTSGSAAATATPTGPRVLAEGGFVSQEHETSGTARVLEQDGSRLLRLEDFSTSDGPDVHVWLSDAAAGGTWAKYDDGRHISLGRMKATDGNQNYAIPADADLTGMRSVVIWCDRFDVAFGSAALDL